MQTAKDGVKCPVCRGPAAPNAATGKLTCALCGYAFTGDTTPGQVGAHPIMQLTHRGEINYRARSAFETAQYAVIRGNKAEALDALSRALDFQPDFADAHLWLSRLLDDPKQKRDHLSEIIAHFPNHLEATRDLMVLNGQLTAQEAAQTHHANDPTVKRVEQPVAATTSKLRCPVCGGDLTVDPFDGRVICRFCGYRAEKAVERAGGVGESLTMALLERKAQPVKWRIGGRLLHCTNCGAERTIPATALSQRCPFCDTNHVVVQDALGSFEQPDGLVPFEVSEENADANIREAVKSLGQRLLNLFDPNAIKRLEMDGVYLPFWVFDALADVRRTFVKKESGYYDRTPRLPPEPQEFRDGCYDLTIPAVTNPSPRLMYQLGGVDFERVLAYKPKLLARYPAELYDVDFDKASLEARSHAANILRRKHDDAPMTGDYKVQVSVSVMQMQFRLLLLPVWVATITETDGDLRVALVNGQTGKVALGKAQKRK